MYGIKVPDLLPPDEIGTVRLFHETISVQLQETEHPLAVHEVQDPELRRFVGRLGSPQGLLRLRDEHALKEIELVAERLDPDNGVADRELHYVAVGEMAVSLGAGILFSTVITLYLIPCSLLVAQDLGKRLRTVRSWYMRPFRSREEELLS